MPRPAILMYHRIGPSHGGDPWGMTVEPDVFEEQVRWLASARSPLALSEFVERLAKGTLPEDAVAITFDDGYFDNLAIAQPLLEHHKVPATIFIAPGLIGKKAFWWDRLQHLVWTSPKLPATLEVRFADRELRLLLNEADPRAQALSTVWAHMRDVTDEVREEILGRLKNALGSADDQADFRPITHQELTELASGVIEIGAHTVSHAWLPELGSEAKRREIIDSVRLCHDAVGYRPQCFSYPYGAFDQECVQIVRDAGLLAACTVAERHVSADCDPLILPRIVAANDMNAFRNNLNQEHA